MTDPRETKARRLRPDGVLVFFRILTVLGIVTLLAYRARLGLWEKPIEQSLGGCLLVMGFWQIRRLTAGDWWKGDWRRTFRAQSHAEWMALFVALNVILIGLVCLAVVMGVWNK